ncbi:hypothetical protein [Streptomyces sp. NPDC056160]|uniref:hypothetical protein n=1 Tax=Streptomyces sp. NPDC056160 TaxID=3345731 RepID=UPI0035D76721
MPVCRKPGRWQRGQTRLAACRPASRRQIPQWLAVGERTGRPQPAQVREQVMHRPVSACRTRDLPQAGQDARAASSFIRAVQRQQCCRSMKPTGAPQQTQSRCLLPILRPHILQLPDSWWEALARTLEKLSATSTDLVAVREQYMNRAIPEFVGIPAPAVTYWTTAHADLHWANLTTSPLMLLDREGWLRHEVAQHERITGMEGGRMPAP